ncbi:MAG TPA: respiratory nitrate reductase subunit gamma [Desulfomonilaceae bacterium]|nr:respiratory nitrate reductase subunit gamma [Desulfomonilaceae bacterium]
MADKFWYFVLVPMVYLSLAWCIIWMGVKIAELLNAPKFPKTLRIFPEGQSPDDTSGTGWAGAVWDAFTMPAVRRYNPLLWFFLTVFHVTILLLILAHLDMLPQINIVSADSPHMIGNGAVGMLITVCVLYFLFRRFRSPVREVSVPSDYLLLILLLCIILSGDVISWGNSWTENGFVMTKQDFGAYLNSLMKFTFTDPRQFLSGSHYPVIGTHVLLANLFLIFLPFSKIMHVFFAVPMNKLRRG